MAPQHLSTTNVLLADVNESKKNTTNYKETNQSPQTVAAKPAKNEKYSDGREIVWFNVVVFIILHSIALNGIYILIFGPYIWKTFVFNLLYSMWAGVSITGGAHRLWAHKCYKAKLPFRTFLMLGQTAALQNDIHEWVRDHRAHHKFTDTDADPHNSTRGFFFCHIGWLMMKKHQDVKVKGKTIDMSDIEADPVVTWQKKYYIPMVLLLAFLVPTYIPVYFWNEDPMTAFYLTVARFALQLHATWSVNSVAHLWGYKPYDSTINPVENKFVSSVAFGEGWHNYHHTFPWDYKAAELGKYGLNWTAALLDFMASIGQVYDLKTATPEMIRKRALRTGDGTWKDGKIDLSAKSDKKIEKHHFHEDCVWGWDDRDLKDDIKNDTNIIHKEA